MRHLPGTCSCNCITENRGYGHNKGGESMGTELGRAGYRVEDGNVIGNGKGENQETQKGRVGQDETEWRWKRG